LPVVKTTLDLPDALLDEARRTARERGTTLRALVADALRTELTDRAGDQPTAELVEPVFAGQLGLQPGADPGDWEAIRTIAYGRWA
jgi:hypothetical protein